MLKTILTQMEVYQNQFRASKSNYPEISKLFTLIVDYSAELAGLKKTQGYAAYDAAISNENNITPFALVVATEERLKSLGCNSYKIKMLDRMLLSFVSTAMAGENVTDGDDYLRFYYKRIGAAFDIYLRRDICVRDEDERTLDMLKNFRQEYLDSYIQNNQSIDALTAHFSAILCKK